MSTSQSQIPSLRTASRLAFALLTGAATLLPSPLAVAAGTLPSASCTTQTTALDLRTGGGIPLPSSYSNPTSSTVTFTVRMASSYFFGPARTVKTVSVNAGATLPQSSVIPTTFHTPLGGGPVEIEVRSNATGTDVVGRCSYKLHLSAPQPPTSTSPLPSAQRWMYQIPVQLCAMEGSAVAGSAKAGQTVAAGRMLTSLADANSSIWYPQAQVAFSTATDSVIPVIADPSAAGSGSGSIGDILPDVPSGRDAADLCTAAWATRFPGRKGIPVIAIRSFIDQPSTYAASPPIPTGLMVKSRKPGTGLRGDALCGSPVSVTTSDVRPFVLLADVMWSQSNPAKPLAHEFGHNLFLGHGNGLDDNGDGRAAGITGPKRYDEYCEPGWLKGPANTEVLEDVNSATPCSLMQRFACSAVIRPLQAETARGVARYLPGFVNGTPVPVLG